MSDHYPEGFDASCGIPASAMRVANAVMCSVTGKREWDVPMVACALFAISASKDEQIRKLREALTTLDARLRECSSNRAISAADAYDSFYQEEVRAALKEES